MLEILSFGPHIFTTHTLLCFLFRHQSAIHPLSFQLDKSQSNKETFLHIISQRFMTIISYTRMVQKIPTLELILEFAHMLA